MPDCSILPEALQLGARVVDLATGELLASDSARRGVTAGGSPVREEPAGGPRHAHDAQGLSKAHNCTSEGTATFWLGGSLLNCKKPAPAGKEQKGGGKRGKVQEFSPASRRRMLYLVGKIERVKLPIMVTLTYPGDFPASGETWKNHLRRWYQRLKRRLPGAGLIWKLEPQKRGAPHFHLLVWGVDRVPLGEFRAWVSRSWYQVVGSGDERHLHAGTRCEQIRDRRGVLAYATKYLGKVISEMDAEKNGWDQPGRFWGVKGAECIPWASLVQVAVTYRQAVKLLRLMRRAMRCHRGNLPGLTLLSNDPDFWFDRLDRLIHT